MAAEFIGYTILVTLQQPPGAQIEGVVSDVVNQTLYLRNVLLCWSGQRLPAYTLEATAIADLEVAASARHDEVLTPVQSQPSAQFVDPAIVGYSKPSRPQPIHAATLPTPISPVMIANGAVSSPPPHAGQRNLKGRSSISSIATARKTERRDSTATATLTEPFDAMALKNKEAQEQSANPEKRKSQTAPGIIDMKDINHAPLQKNKKQTQQQQHPHHQQQPGKGRGWRNTPLIEERPSRTSRKQRGRQTAEDVNGWATEDATDIAEMGEFDFASNLSKFDKRKVFDDIRRDDTTADEDRLVSHNRKQPKPGTNGGRNLHFTENVLDIPDHTADASRWKSEAGETEDSDDEGDQDKHDYSSGRGSRRAGSRRPLQSRKGSAIPPHLETGHTRQKDTSPARPMLLNRNATASPLNGAAGSSIISNDTGASTNAARGSFRITSNNKPCHTVSPLQMLEVEQLCMAELGLTEDIVTENAGRSIAEAILKSPQHAPPTPITPTGPTAASAPEHPKNILFLAGNHKTGARAIAAARHLRNRRLRVTVVVLGLERSEDVLYEVVRKQLNIYRSGGGYTERWEDYVAKQGNGQNPAADFVVDALLGVHFTGYEELRGDDLANIFGMIKWVSLGAGSPQPDLQARKAQAKFNVMSIDVPSGISATTGLPAEIDGQPIVMPCRQIVCLGAPKTGLLLAVSNESIPGAANWAVSVVDIGISTAAWQRNGSRRKQGVEFGTEWVVALRAVNA